MDIFCTRMNKGRLRLNGSEVLLRCIQLLRWRKKISIQT